VAISERTIGLIWEQRGIRSAEVCEIILSRWYIVTERLEKAATFGVLNMKGQFQLAQLYHLTRLPSIVVFNGQSYEEYDGIGPNQTKPNYTLNERLI
jgi:hypothetical protein